MKNHKSRKPTHPVEALSGRNLAIDDALGHVFISKLFNNSIYYSLKIPSDSLSNNITMTPTTLSILDMQVDCNSFSLTRLYRTSSHETNNCITISFMEIRTNDEYTLSYNMDKDDLFPQDVYLTNSRNETVKLHSLFDNWYHLYRRLHDFFPDQYDEPCFSDGAIKLEQLRLAKDNS